MNWLEELIIKIALAKRLSFGYYKKLNFYKINIYT